MEAVIEIQNFSKSFGKFKAVDNLSFDVKKGEIFAFLGSNGAGKTTTLRCLLNIYKPDAGILNVLGQTFSSEISNKVGYLPEERGLYLDSKVLDTLMYFGQIKGMSKIAAKKFSLDFLERVELQDKADTVVKRLSSGQQQKIQLGITIINKPELLILDEPTKGLDPVNRELLTSLLLELNKAGTTIIFSTHHMEEAEKIAKRLLILKNGKNILYGSMEDIKEEYATNELIIKYSGVFKNNSKIFKIANRVSKNEVVVKGQSTKDIINYFNNQDSIQLISVSKNVLSLDQIFIKVTSKND